MGADSQVSEGIDNYIYAQLNHPSCIRLLRIHPGLPGDPLQCSLRIVDLKSKPAYHALSYCWGRETDSWSRFEGSLKRLIRDGRFGPIVDASTSAQDVHVETDRPRRISCNGAGMYIKSNLYHGLLEIRHEKRYKTYWIDAVCINQGDDQEKCKQVQMMGQIYTAAQSVIVWLGKCPLALSPMITIALSSAQKDFTRLSEDSATFKDQIDLAIMAAPLILSRKWFRRAWIVQEFCLAKRLMFYFGQHRISLDQMTNMTKLTMAFVDHASSRTSLAFELQYSTSRLYRFFESFGDVRVRFSRTEHIRNQLDNTIRMLDARQKYQRGVDWTWDDWLCISRGREATDFRDLAYAGFSLLPPSLLRYDASLQPSKELFGTLRSRMPYQTDANRPVWFDFKPDYTSDVSGVLLRLALCLLSQKGGLDMLLRLKRQYSNEILDCARRSAKGVRIPTWFPNLGFYHHRSYQDFHGPGGRDCRAGSQWGAKPIVSHDGLVLSVQAAQLGVITIHATFQQFPTYQHSSRIVGFLDFMILVAKSDHVQSATTALCEVLTADCQQRFDRIDASIAFCSCLHDAFVREAQDYHEYKSKYGNISTRRPSRELEKRTEHFQDLSRAYSEVKAADPSAPWPHQIWGSSTREPQVSAKLKDLFASSCSGALRRGDIFLTHTGYVGIGPHAMSGCDVAMLIKGVSLPYVLTRVGEASPLHKMAKTLCTPFLGHSSRPGNIYEALKASLAIMDYGPGPLRLVGQAYIHGLMLGEAVDPLEAENRFMPLDIV